MWNGNALATIETDDDRTYFLMTISCREDFVGIPMSVDQGEWSMPSQLEQVLGQVSVQVQETISQSDIKKKILA